MLKWQDPLTEPIASRLKTLAHELRHMKADGWSVVLSANEIIVRPQDRTTGKFSITFVSGEKCAVSFFSRELNYWNKSKYFDPNVSLAEPIKEWMESAATEPVKIDHADWQDTRM